MESRRTVRSLLASFVLAALAAQAFVAVVESRGEAEPGEDVKKPDCVPGMDPRSFPGTGGGHGITPVTPSHGGSGSPGTTPSHGGGGYVPTPSHGGTLPSPSHGGSGSSPTSPSTGGGYGGSPSTPGGGAYGGSPLRPPPAVVPTEAISSTSAQLAGADRHNGFLVAVIASCYSQTIMEKDAYVFFAQLD
ncbi:unnamed protein product [Miscanthus lutarioriparius]|uniref:Uncharacterized protein n=1 Tax=Miscanthus lutarioriparius TaxID=422564 RepID=A0A811PU89_9POAL|nr:unnamed protein product [Miscanthus lutarioriparius]